MCNFWRHFFFLFSKNSFEPEHLRTSFFLFPAGEATMIYSIHQAPTITHTRLKKNLTQEDRMNIIAKLLSGSQNGNLRRGDIKAAAEEFHCDRSTIYRLWQRRLCSITTPTQMGSFGSKIKENSGHMQLDREWLLERLKKIPLSRRTTQSAVANLLGVSRSVVCRLLASGHIKRHGSRLRPALTNKNKIDRIQFIFSWLNEAKTHFQPMYNVVHVDEKWFNQDKDKKPCYLARDEEEPHRETRHKRHIPKIMFLAAVARPR